MITRDRNNAYLYLQQSEFEKIIEIEQRIGQDDKLDVLYCIAHIFLGNVRKAYNKLSVGLENNSFRDYPEAFQLASNWVKILGNAGFEYIDLQEPYDFTRSQSVENSMEEYPELSRLNMIVRLKDDREWERYSMEINQLRYSNDYKQRALAQFITAEIAIFQDDFETAVRIYLSTINEDPNVALYWGYCAQVMNTHLNFNPFLTLYLIQNAISLDPHNPRWHFIKAQIIAKLALLEKENPWMETSWLKQYEKEMIMALNKCQEKQTSLKSGIQDFVNFLDGHFHNKSRILR